MSLDLLAIASELSTAWTTAKAVAAEAVPLYNAAASAMATVESAFGSSSATGAAKKQTVLGTVQTVATAIEADYNAVSGDISTFIDSAKTLYNNLSTIVEQAVAAKAAAAPAAPAAPAPQPEA